ncbi:chloride channel [Xylariaceae sp. FL0804]|nr:chloride channel [Xylariaceae sp. FL0804]
MNHEVDGNPEGDALLSPRDSESSYQSFPQPRAGSRSSDAGDSGRSSDEASFADALSYISANGARATACIATRLRQCRTRLAAVVCRQKMRRHMQRMEAPYLRDSLAVVATGVATAVVACIVDIGESRIFDWKYGICNVDWTASKSMCCSEYTDECPQWQTWSEFAGVSKSRSSAFNFFVYLALVLSLAGVSHAWTRCTPARRAPPAGDDDLQKQPPPRAYFAAAGSGVADVRQAVAGAGERAAWTKSTLVLKTLGLIASTSSGLSVGKEGPYVHLGAGVANLINRAVPACLAISGRKTLFIGSAAGMAVAFGAPLAGAAQSLSTTLFTLLLGGGVVAVIALTGLNPYGSNKVVPWEVRYKTSWEYNEAVIFLLVGVAAGILGALFTGGVRLWSNTYRQIPLVKRYPSLDVLLVALMTACGSFWVRYLRYGTSELVSGLSAGDSTAVDSAEDPTTLVLSLLAKFFLTMITFGLQIPQGIYMPSMAMGAMLGRCIGQTALVVLRDGTLFGSAFNPNLGVYAMAGAGAVMAGIVRLQLCIIVLVFETTQSWEYIIPFTISILTAKFVAACLEPQGIYDLAADLHGQPSLDAILGALDSRVEDVWEPQDASPPSLNLASSLVVRVYSLKRLLDAAAIVGSHRLPVLRQRAFVGCVSSRSFSEALRPLHDSLQIALEQESGDVLQMRAIVGDDGEECAGEAPVLGLMQVDDGRGAEVARLKLQHPAVFECCSTLSSIRSYFLESDADYICVTRHGVSWAVVTRETLAQWVKRVPSFRRSPETSAAGSVFGSPNWAARNSV